MLGLIGKLLKEHGVLLADGATGSNLFAVGLQTGDSPELWNDIYPERIARHYQSFIDAGSDIFLTNTFGGTRFRLKLHSAEKRVTELNVKAAQIAQGQVKQADREVAVGGSMGPTGEIFKPLGALSIEEATDAFEEQAHALKAGGVDLLWIETMSSQEEAKAAVIGGSRVGLPMVTTFSIDTNGRTMMGLSPADIIKLYHELETIPFAIGVNCGVGAAESIAAVVNMVHAANSCNRDPIIIVKANCGVPEYIDEQIVYSGTEEVMAEYTKLAVDAGARIIGGCCGTTPSHVKKMRQVLDSHQKSSIPDASLIEEKLGEISIGAQAQLRGELNISAKKRSVRRRFDLFPG